MDTRSQFVLERLGVPRFRPVRMIRGGWGQTIAGVYWPQWPNRRPTATHIVPLPDGDRLMVMENRPETWQPGQRIVVMVHGLTGSYRSKDLVRLCRKFTRAGWLVLRVNLRTSGPSMNLAKYPYHSGRSADLRVVQEWIAGQFPLSPVTQLGISLGGNITLKLVGEDGSAPTGNLDSAIAVSPPIDITKSWRHIRQHKFFDQYFTKRLVKHVRAMQKCWPDMPYPDLAGVETMRRFDEVFTAPVCGFRDADDYYEKASSAPHIPAITVPTLILSAEDDPIVEAQTLRDLPALEHLDVVITPVGGHVGFLGPGENLLDYRWMDSLILRWISRLPGTGAGTRDSARLSPSA